MQSLRCAATLIALQVVTVGCTRPDRSADTVSGEWVLAKRSSKYLNQPPEVRVRIFIHRTGRFTAEGLPCTFLGSPPKGCHQITGGGAWKLANKAARDSITMTLESIEGNQDVDVPYGTQLWIKSADPHTVLFFFDGDPDLYRTIEFELRH